MASGYGARAEAALRLPPLASGHRDPLTAVPARRCHICDQAESEARPTSLLFYLASSRKWMCRDRVACFQRARIR